jgi:FtsH-binding integral membrane protein
MTRIGPSRAYALVAWALVLVGVAHTALTVVAYQGITVEALWFAGTGICVIVAGAINLCVNAGIEGPGARALLILCASTTVVLALLAAAFSGLTGLREPQGLLLILLFAAATVYATGRLRRLKRGASRVSSSAIRPAARQPSR